MSTYTEAAHEYAVTHTDEWVDFRTIDGYDCPTGCGDQAEGYYADPDTYVVECYTCGLHVQMDGVAE